MTLDQATLTLDLDAPVTIAAGVVVEEPVSIAPPTSTRREYRCGVCGRRLPHERWIYSRHTGSRYCTAAEGCNTPAGYRRAARKAAAR